jgi:AcrR family transcriptional regulator
MKAKQAKSAATKSAASANTAASNVGARERILATARNLIYREGARAVGIDRIVAESGVAKMSLYRWFPSKDDLIVAVLDEERRRVLDVWDANIARNAGNPLAQLRAQFVSLATAISSPNYRGCAFLNAAMAFADKDHPARAVVKSFKQEIVDRFAGLAKELGVKDPQGFAQQLSLLADGAHASGQSVGAKGPSSQLVDMVEVLIAANVPQRKVA